MVRALLCAASLVAKTLSRCRDSATIGPLFHIIKTRM